MIHLGMKLGLWGGWSRSFHSCARAVDLVAILWVVFCKLGCQVSTELCSTVWHWWFYKRYHTVLQHSHNVYPLKRHMSHMCSQLGVWHHCVVWCRLLFLIQNSLVDNFCTAFVCNMLTYNCIMSPRPWEFDVLVSYRICKYCVSESFNAIYFGPEAPEDHVVPVIVNPHGGPHSVLTDSFSVEKALFASLGKRHSIVRCTTPENKLL
jgi:Dipeptidyl aminopeptidases/acylaminoacyl-peptidases